MTIITFITIAISVILMIVFVYATYTYYIKTRDFLKDLKKSCRLICFENDHRKNFYDRYSNINSELIKNKAISHKWHEFKEHLIKPTENEISKEGAELVIKNSIFPSKFFTYSNIFGEKVSMGFYEFLPKFFTGLGVFGTFLGLSIGTYAALGAMNKIDNFNHLFHSLGILLSSASLAFITSLFGVFFSLVFSWFLNKRKCYIENFILNFNDNLEKCLKFVTQEQLLRDLSENNEDQKKILKTFTNDLAIAIENALKKPIESGLNNILNKLNNINDNFGGKLGNFNDKLIENLIDKLSGGLVHEANENKKKAQFVLEKMANDFEERGKGIMDIQDNMISSHKEIIEKSLSREKEINELTLNGVKSIIANFEEFFESLKTKFREDIVNSSCNIVKDIDRSTKSFYESFSSTNSMFRDELLKILDKYNESSDLFQKSVFSFSGATTKISKDLAVMSDISEKNNNIFKCQNQTIYHIKNYVDDFNKISSEIKQVSNQFSDSSGSLRSVSEYLKNFSTDLKGGTTEIVQSWRQAAELSKNTNFELEEVFEKFLVKSKDFHEVVNNYANQLSKTYEGAIQKLSDHFLSNIDNLNDSICDLQDSLKKILNPHERSDG